MTKCTLPRGSENCSSLENNREYFYFLPEALSERIIAFFKRMETATFYDDIAEREARAILEELTK